MRKGRTEIDVIGVAGGNLVSFRKDKSYRDQARSSTTNQSHHQRAFWKTIMSYDVWATQNIALVSFFVHVPATPSIVDELMIGVCHDVAYALANADSNAANAPSKSA